MFKTKKKEDKPDTCEASLKFDLILIYKFVFAVPILAFASCIFLTLLLNFEESVFTHCRVQNYLPSISSAIGGFKLQKYIWQHAIALQSAPRIFVAIVFHKFYPTFPSGTNGIHLKVLTFVDIVENLSLLFLTIISSTDVYELHYFGFMSFVICSQLHMGLKILMIQKIRNDPGFCLNHKKSLNIRKGLWAFNLFFIVLAAYFFNRHNLYCEPGVYTLFALSEYIIVMSNVAFHGAGFYEFHNTALTIDVGTYYRSKNKPA